MVIVSEPADVTPEQAFDQYHQAVHDFAYRLTLRKDVAEDITQECFLALISAPRRFDPARGTMRAYLFSIVRHLALKHYRHHAVEALLEDDPPATPDRQQAPDLSSAVADAVAALPQLQQEAIILFQYEGATLEEIANIVGADVGTVKSRLHRARNALRRTLAPYRKAGSTDGTV